MTEPAKAEPGSGLYPETPLSTCIDRVIRRIGEALSWLWLGLLCVIVVNVGLRTIFGIGSIALEEAQWHVYALGFLVGLAYCVQNDSHVRVDFLRIRMRPRSLAWIELYGTLLLLLPFTALVLFAALPFVQDAFVSNEVSPSPGGLPLRWLVKACLPLGFALLVAASFSRLLRVGAALFGAPPGAGVRAPGPD